MLVLVRSMLTLAAGLALLASGCGGAAAPPTAPMRTAAAATQVDPCVKTDARFVQPVGGLPDETFPCLVGSTAVRLRDLRGAPAVVNLWASWCDPCRREMPALQVVHERWGERVQFLGVNVRDDRDAALSFLADVGVTYPQAVDVVGRLPARLGSPGLPVTVVLDRAGAVVWKRIGELDPADLDRELTRALGAGQAGGSGQ